MTEYNFTHIAKKIENEGISASLKGIIKNHNENAGRQLRKDASIGVEMIFSYSPSVPFSAPFVKEYQKCIFSFLKKEFPQFRLMRLDLHCDENSVHWHVVGVCLDNQKKICTRQTLGGPAEMRKHQDNFALEVAHLGLSRGIPKKQTHRRHETKNEWQRRLEIQKEAQRALDDIGL